MSREPGQRERTPGPAASDVVGATRADEAAATGPEPAAGPTHSSRSRRRWLARYPNAYAWFVFLAALDIMLTYLILHPVLFFHDSSMTESRGREANALAAWIIRHWDVPGMVVFKFATVVLVVVLCEVIGRHKDETGRRLAEWAVAISAIPVIIALAQMGFDIYAWFHPRP